MNAALVAALAFQQGFLLKNPSRIPPITITVCKAYSLPVDNSQPPLARQYNLMYTQSNFNETRAYFFVPNGTPNLFAP